MAEQVFNTKEIIFQEGDPSDCAYIIAKGKVEILKNAPHGEVRLAVLEAGAPFGEMGLFDHAPRSATARAVEPTSVERITESDLKEMVSACPPKLVPLLHATFDRLRATTSRVSEKEQANVVLDSEMDHMVIKPGEPIKGLFEPIALPVAQLPFKIGGYEAGGAPNTHDHNHLNIPCEGPPLVISRNHCEIMIEAGGVYLMDKGSRFGTVVNGQQIGRGKGRYLYPLQMGENKVQLGGKLSKYTLIFECK